MRELTVTQFATLKEDSIDEVSIDAFIKKVAKDVKSFYMNKAGNIMYEAKVLKLDENYFSVEFTDEMYHFFSAYD